MKLVAPFILLAAAIGLAEASQGHHAGLTRMSTHHRISQRYDARALDANTNSSKKRSQRCKPRPSSVSRPLFNFALSVEHASTHHSLFSPLLRPLLHPLLPLLRTMPLRLPPRLPPPLPLSLPRTIITTMTIRVTTSLHRLLLLLRLPLLLKLPLHLPASLLLPLLLHQTLSLVSLALFQTSADLAALNVSCLI